MRTLNRFIHLLGLSFLLMVTAGIAYAQEGQEKSTQPDIRWDVNKEFDENGNIIRYDSSYSYSFSTPGFNDNLPDSLREFFEHGFPGFTEDDPFLKSPFGQSPFIKPVPPSGRFPHFDPETDSLLSELFNMPSLNSFFDDHFFDDFFNDEFSREDSTLIYPHDYPFFNPFSPGSEDIFKKQYELMEKIFNLHQLPPDSLEFDRQHWNAPPARKKFLKELEI